MSGPTPPAAPATRRAVLGGSGVAVTRLGFGTAAIAGLYSEVAEDEAIATIEAAWDAGIRYFDTAPHYGLGVSERRLGVALRGRPRAEYTVSTKVGRVLEPIPGAAHGDDRAHGFSVPATHRRVWDFSSDGVRRSLEDSLVRLGLDHVDIALIHDPDEHAEQAFGEAYPALERLRDEGVVRAIGAGMNQSAMLTRFVEDTDVDVVLCAGRYTLLEQPALDDLLPAAAARGTSVIIGGIYNSGLLADPAAPGATYDYGVAPRHLLDRARASAEVTEAHGVPLRAAALHFPLGHPAVVSVLTGARSVEEVQDTAALFQRAVPPRVWDELHATGLLPPAVPVPGKE
ncbi:aldo/keto reductase [Wenjunlia vitaminophila]|uniref:Aldo/keto reductase n=1 Tax=Wenjunlia vitaminophila TaxID=76728 RepID=A0A0T6LP55_WENVI|nr:aldo/keto reductase [Wenjunlia vitaminophila]KRV47882.1 aldo/keto reductase [Wenjunlia vitaminophila]